jgi:hypothetical protein
MTATRKSARLPGNFEPAESFTSLTTVLLFPVFPGAFFCRCRGFLPSGFIDDNSMECEIEVRPEMAASLGILHGGIRAAMLCAVLGMLANHHVARYLLFTGVVFARLFCRIDHIVPVRNDSTSLKTSRAIRPRQFRAC